MELLDAIEARFSYRGMYRADPAPREDLRRIMEAGLAAPSGGNAQTTDLIGLDDPAVVAEVGGLLGKPHFASAPAAICVLSRRVVTYQTRCFSVQDYSAAIENMLLAATALGYASCWVEGYITDSFGIGAKIAARLGVPDEYEVVAYLPIGRPAEEKQRASRKPFEARASFNGFSR